MATNSLVVGGWHATTDYFKNGNIFLAIGGTTRGGTLALEVNVQRKVLVAHSLTSLGCMVTSSSTGANVTSLKSRIGGANGNLNVTLTSSVTGWQQDTTHSDSIASTNLINIAFVGTSAAPDCFITQHAVTVNATSPLSFLTWSSLEPTDANSYSLSGATNTFTQLSGGTAGVGAGETTETATSQIALRCPGTTKGLMAILTTNTTGSTITFRNNGVNGNQTISPGTTAAGALTQDSTHTDAVISGDAADYVFNAGSHTMNTTLVGVEIVGTTSGQDLVTSEQSGTTSIGTSDVFMGIGNSWGTNATETQTQTKVPYACTGSRMRIHMVTNSRSVAMTMTSRVGAAAGNQTITISASTTGVLEDTTHSDTLAANSLINHKIASTGGTGSAIYNWAVLKLDDGSVAGGSTETGTITTTLSGISQTVTVNDHRATITTTLTGISQRATGAREEDSTIHTTLSGLSQTLTANNHTSHITTTLSGASQSGVISVVKVIGTITSSLSGPSQHGTVFVAEEYGTITTHLSGLSQRAVGSDLSTLTTLRQFWTFGT